MLAEDRDAIFESAEELARRGARISKKRVLQIAAAAGGAVVLVGGTLFGYRAWRARQPPPPLRLDPVGEAEEASAANHPAADPTEPAEPESNDNGAAPAPEAPEASAGNDSSDGEGESATQHQDDSDPHVRVVSGTLGTGGTFYDVLASLGVGPAQIRDVTEALRGSVDFRASQPNHGYQIRQDRETHNVLALVYRVSETEAYEATRGGDGKLHAHRKAVRVEHRRHAAGGVVETSLFDAVDRAGLRPSIVPQFVEIFASLVNFFTDQRRGDTFRIVADEEIVDGQFVRYGTVEAIEYRGARAGEQRAFYYEDHDGFGDYYDEHGRSVHKSMLKTPLRYVRISSGFNPHRFHPILHRVTGHMGVDYSAPTGTPVWATADGVVVSVGPAGGAGNLVVLRHEGGLESLYMHLSRFATGLREGMRVRQRQVIAFVGATGLATGPHLHFALRRAGQFVNPLAMQSGPGRMIAASSRGEFDRRVAELAPLLAAIRIGPASPAPATAPTGSSLVAVDSAPPSAPAKNR